MAEVGAPVPASFDELRDMRRSFVAEARRNGLEEGLRTLLADLYPDKAHFIYELLQNAEDAQATVVEFELRRDALIATHNGQRKFSLRDITNITGIGNSGKKDDDTQIGKFGVGFKAVFAYTNRPEVRSGRHAFAITDLVVPERLDSHSDTVATTFAFPFDRPEKPADVAYAEIEKGLRALDEKTLLFLTSIGSITYTLADGSVGLIDRTESDDLTVVIQKSDGDDFVESRWLRLVGPASGHPQGAMPLQVAAAFRLAPAKPARRSAKSGSGAAAPQHVIVPLAERDAEVSIYFPAVNVEAGLRFHIHAPFASTVARDSVRATPENYRLVEDIGALIAANVMHLRDLGIVDDGFLEALPNAGDPLEAPYSAIRDAVVEAFNSQPVTPVHGGGFARATELVSTPDEVRSGLEMKDLSTLLELAGTDLGVEPRWIAPRRGGAERFLQQLDTFEFGWDEFDSSLKAVETTRRRAVIAGRWVWQDHAPQDLAIDRWDAWLTTKSDANLLGLYGLVGRGVDDGEISAALKSIPMVRLRGRGGLSHVRGSSTYLPENRRDKVQARVPAELAYFDDDEQDRPGLRSFYRAAGVERWNANTRIETRLEPYRRGLVPTPDEGGAPTKHLDDMAAFVKYAKEHPSEAADLFKGVEIVLAADDGDDWQWVAPGQIYLDEPFGSTGLAAVYHDTTWSLPGIYAGVDGITEFLVALGAVDRVRLVATSVRRNRLYDRAWSRGTRESEYTVDRDWDIEHFAKIVATGDPRLLRSLWETIARSKSDRGTATFRANRSKPWHHIKSKALQNLQSTPWIPDPDGDLVRPRQIDVGDLPPDWVQTESGTLARELDFGADAEARREQAERDHARHQEDLAAASRLGITPEKIEFIRMLEAAEISEQDLREFVASRAYTARLPGEASEDPERRAAMAAAVAADADEYQTVQRLRTLPVGAGTARAESKNYLRQHYTNDAGEMACQACWESLPFQVGGHWYFELTEFVRDREYVHQANALALCPLCAALYRHAIGTSPEVLIAGLMEAQIDRGQGSVKIPVLLDGKRARIRFTAKHAIDLRSALRVAGSVRPRSRGR